MPFTVLRDCAILIFTGCARRFMSLSHGHVGPCRLGFKSHEGELCHAAHSHETISQETDDFPLGIRLSKTDTEGMLQRLK